MSRKRYIQLDKPNKGIYINPLKPKNSSQEYYIKLMQESTVTFGIGPAGTGKTYLAVHTALDLLLKGEYEKVILTRPIVAVEDIGFLPGDMHDKIHPYILPLLDAIEDHVGPTKAKELLTMGSIEIVPLAYCRGRGFNRSILLGDELQNSTPEQMKMLLTRIGYDSKMILTGDLNQSDLHIPLNGLKWATERLIGVSSQISIHEFHSSEIVRNPLIGTMLSALDLSPQLGIPRRHSDNDEGAGKLIDLSKPRKSRLLGE